MFIDEIIRICLTSDTQAPVWGTTRRTRAADVGVNPVQPPKQASGPLRVKRYVSAIIREKLCSSAAFCERRGRLQRPDWFLCRRMIGRGSKGTRISDQYLISLGVDLWVVCE